MASEETTEQRLARLERDFGGSMVQVARSLSDMETTLYDVRAVQTAHSGELIKTGKRLAKIEGRLDAIEATMATKEDLVALRVQMRQDMEELKTQVLGSFQQMLAVLDERLPKQ